MTLFQELLEKGVREFPQCEECSISEKEQKEINEKAFLILVEGRLVCGRCGVKLTTQKICNCGKRNKGTAIFCNECGAKF